METELTNPPSAEYIPQKNSKPALQPISPKKQILQQTKSILSSVLDGLGGFKRFQRNIKETSSPNPSKKRRSLPFSDYIKQSKVFVLRSSQESNEEKCFETVTDKDKPYIHCMMSGAIIATPFAFKQVGIPIGVTLIIVFAFLIDDFDVVHICKATDLVDLTGLWLFVSSYGETMFTSVLLSVGLFNKVSKISFKKLLGNSWPTFEFSFFAYYSSLLLIQNSLLAQKDTYRGIVKEAFGKAICIAVCFMTFYHAVLGDILPKLANRILLLCEVDDFRVGRRYPVIMVALLILIPLCLCRSIRQLSKFSLISWFCVTALITFSLIRLTTIGHHVPYTHSPFRFSNMNAFQGIGVVMFLYLSHHSSYLFNSSIRDSAPSRLSNTTYASISYSLLCTLMLGIVGFITFKGLVQGDFLENYCEEDDMANIARLFIALLIIMHYPLECHGGREIIYKTFLSQRTLSLSLHMATTIMMVVVACLISMFLDCVSLILEISGLLFAIPLVMVIPCGSFLRLSKGSVCSLKKLPCLILASAGFMIIIVGIVMVAFMPHGCIHTTKYLPYCNGSSELLGPLITLMSLNETMQLDPLLNYNVTEFGYENITDIAAAYFT